MKLTFLVYTGRVFSIQGQRERCKSLHHVDAVVCTGGLVGIDRKLVTGMLARRRRPRVDIVVTPAAPRHETDTQHRALTATGDKFRVKMQHLLGGVKRGISANS